jgi:hypothetical protein
MPDLKRPDSESLRLELQEAITTFRHQTGLLIQALGFILTADSVLLAYGFAQRQSGVLLVASLMPIALLIVLIQFMVGLVPICYVAIKLERKLSLREEPHLALVATFVQTRDDLPFSSLENIENADVPKVHDSVLVVLKSRKSLILLCAFAVQLCLVVISITVFHYRFM